VSVLSPEIVRLLSRREAYWDAWQVVPFIALSYVLYGLYFQGAVGINLEKKTKVLPFVVGTAAVVNLALNYLLIRPWGMMGAATSTLLSYLLLVILVFRVSQRYYAISYEWGRLFRLGALAGGLYLASLALPDVTAVARLGLKCGLLLLFPLFLLAGRFFAPEELARGRQLASAGWQKLKAGLRHLLTFPSRL
jgi:O-antigen/teichoic acid export membrane protein